MTPAHYLITGCSGGGKSTLLAALKAKGHIAVPEPGRRIIAEELGAGSGALPWVDAGAFARRAVAMSRQDLTGLTSKSPVFFDRGLIDAAVALEAAGGPPLGDTLGGPSPYDQKVFVAPPWPQIFATDSARRHGMAEALAEYDRLVVALVGLGHTLIPLPKRPVSDRVAFVISHLV